VKIERTNNTPEVIFDNNNRYISFHGPSYPFNSKIFYEPIKENLIKFLEKLGMDKKNMVIVFAFSILNSTSRRYIFEFLRIINDFSKDNKLINIKWYYEEDDEDMETEYEILIDSFKDINIKNIIIDNIDEIIKK